MKERDRVDFSGEESSGRYSSWEKGREENKGSLGSS